MKKIFKVAVAASILTAPVMAADYSGIPKSNKTNMENPLFLPAQGQVYSKTSFGVMAKKLDGTAANQTRGQSGMVDAPIYRAYEDLGYGITDRLAVHGSFGYTDDGDLTRKGLHLGRIGATYRMLGDMNTPVWDIYADAHMGGVGKMKGSLETFGTGADTKAAFKYDNFSNGRWGFHVGTKMGNTWGKLTGVMFAEVLQTFGNDNNEIGGFKSATTTLGALYGMPSVLFNGVPDVISVDLRSTTEFNAGLKTFYQFDDAWSMGGAFMYKHHANNGINSLATDLTAVNPITVGFIEKMLASYADMQDGWDEYIFTASVANQLTDYTQVALYAEYTADTAQIMSQNGTDYKIEGGVRLNVLF